MPEYLAPGVYVEEVSFRSKSIEGVSTTTTGFIGPARYGPLDLEPELLTSLGEFERIYGDGQPLEFSSQAEPLTNYLWQAARAFFEEGGRRLYVVRTFLRGEVGTSDRDQIVGKATEKKDGEGTLLGYYDEGVGYARLPTGAADDDTIEIQARFPGELGNLHLHFTLSLGQNLLGSDADGQPTPGALQVNDVVWVTDIGSPIASFLGSPISSPLTGMPDQTGKFYLARQEPDPLTQQDRWVFYDKAGLDAGASGQPAFGLQDLVPTMRDAQGNLLPGDEVRAVTLTVTVTSNDPFDLPRVWAGLPLDPDHKQVGSGAPDSFLETFARHLSNRANEYRIPIIMSLGKNVSRSGLHVLEALDQASQQVRTTAVTADLLNPKSSDLQRSFDILLKGGNDGQRPTATEYAGTADPDVTYKTGMKAFEDMDDVSIIAAPGSSYGYEDGYNADARTIMGLLISHAERMRYRIAVLDAGDGQTISQVRDLRAKLDSKYAALYFPWVRVLDPISRKEIVLPPSGFVAGIYARNDVTRAVYKAPANEVVNLALGFEVLLNKAQQDVLNPEGINCFRYFEGRGYRLWGARTISSDPEWKYVNLRRYFAYLEHSIDRGTQWAVFEPNGELLWANVRRTIEDFLLNEWQMGALLGDKPEKAFFVRCDRSTMTQNDLDNGRLVCLVGVAALRPAEFVIFRIGQWTADATR